MQPFKSYVAALVLLVLAMSSCQKNSSELTQNRPTDISVEEAKNWLSLGPAGIQPIALQHRNPGTPDWGNAQFFKFQDKSSILKVPLIDYYLPVGYRDILFQKDSNGIILGAIQEIRPGKAYLAAKAWNGDEDMRQFVTNEDFTGDMIVFDPFDNVPLRGRRFKDGLVTGDLRYKSRALMVDDPTGPVDPKKKPGGLDDDGPGFEIDLPPIEVTAPGPGTPSTPGTNIPFPSEPVLPKPGGPVTPNNPIPIGGGGSGSSKPATSGDVTVTDIKNNLSNPCLQAMLNAALSNQLKSWVAKTVNSLGGNGGNYDFVFREKPVGSFANANVLGEFDRNDSHLGGNEANKTKYGVIYINLNQDSLPRKPKEFIASAIYHEIIHGVLAINKVNFDYQHETMAESYRQKIAEGLKALFPAISDEDANALGWVGLVKTYQFSSLGMKDFQNNTGIASNIVKIALAYQTGQKGTPSGCK